MGHRRKGPQQDPADRRRPALHPFGGGHRSVCSDPRRQRYRLARRLINYLLTNDKIPYEYLKVCTNASFIVKAGFGFSGGLFTSYNEQKRDCDRSSRGYEIGGDGCAKVDETLLDPRCVFQLMKAHHACYIPEMSPKDKLLRAWQWIAETWAPDQAMTSMYALGWTQHSEASQNLRAMVMVQLLLGNMSLGGHLPGRKMAACLGGHPR